MSTVSRFADLTHGSVVPPAPSEFSSNAAIGHGPRARHPPASERRAARSAWSPTRTTPSALSFVVVPHLCRTDGRFYGGAALAVALAASEAVTGRPALWSSTQLVATADLDAQVRVDVDVVAAGRSVSQVNVRGTVEGTLIFAAVGGTAAPRPAASMVPVR